MEQFTPPFTVKRGLYESLTCVKDTNDIIVSSHREFDEALRVCKLLTDAYKIIAELQRRPEAVVITREGSNLNCTPIRDIRHSLHAAQRYSIAITIGSEVYAFESTVCTVTPKERVVESHLVTNRVGDSAIVPVVIEDTEGKQRYAT